MEIILELLNHIWSILGLILTLYCYTVIRKSRFVVVNESNCAIINCPSNIDVKFNNLIVRSNIRYYKFLICYNGVVDINQEDVAIPITIKNNDENSRFHNLKILETSRTFNPRIKWLRNEIQIENTLIKVGDAVLIEFYLESNNENVYFFQRIKNVEIKPKIHVNQSHLLGGAISCFFLFLIFGYLINNEKSNFSKRHLFKEEYNVQYDYKGYRISEKTSFRANRKVDSLYKDNFLKEFRLMNFENDSIARIADLSGKIKIIEGNPYEYRRFLLSEEKSMKMKPSIISDSLYMDFKNKRVIPFSKEIRINNDLKIIFINTKVDTLGDIIEETLFILFISTFAIICLFCATNYALQYWSIRKARKYLYY